MNENEKNRQGTEATKAREKRTGRSVSIVQDNVSSNKNVNTWEREFELDSLDKVYFDSGTCKHSESSCEDVPFRCDTDTMLNETCKDPDVYVYDDLDTSTFSNESVSSGIHDVQVRVNNNSRFSFVTWNINGLLSKLENPDFVSYLSSFDVICLVETFVDTFISTLFPNHTTFCRAALKLSA